MAEIKELSQAKEATETLSTTELQPAERVLLNLIIFIIRWLEDVERTAENAGPPKW